TVAVVITGLKLKVVLYDLKTGNETKVLGVGYELARGLVFSPDGAALAAATEDGVCGVRLWDVSSGKERRHWRAPRGVSGPSFSADGRTIAWEGFRDGSAAGPWVAALTDDAAHTIGGATNYLQAAPALSPDGKTVAAVTDGGAVVLRRTDSGADLLPP